MDLATRHVPQNLPNTIILEIAEQYKASGQLDPDQRRSLIECDAYYIVSSCHRGTLAATATWQPHATDEIARRLDDNDCSDAVHFATDHPVDHFLLQLLSSSQSIELIEDGLPGSFRFIVNVVNDPLYLDGIDDEGILDHLLELSVGYFRAAMVGLTHRRIVDRFSRKVASTLASHLIYLNRRHQILLQQWHKVTHGATAEALPTEAITPLPFDTEREIMSIKIDRLSAHLERQVSILASLREKDVIDHSTFVDIRSTVSDLLATLYQSNDQHTL